jgi:tRNA 2-thiouridine synthesizing protein D
MSKSNWFLSMKYCIIVLGAPYSTQAPVSALKFSKALIKKGHELTRVFFYEDAVHTASRYSCPPNDELNIRAEWEQFKAEHNTDLVVCIAAALKRGIADDGEAQRYDIAEQGNISSSFELSGLGQLVEACAIADKTLTFS